jgi:hypothetical protein
VNDYEIVALEKICGNNSYRDTIEKLWMNKLRTFKPHGWKISVNLAVGTVLFVRMFVTPIHSPNVKEKHLT